MTVVSHIVCSLVMGTGEPISSGPRLFPLWDEKIPGVCWKEIWVCPEGCSVSFREYSLPPTEKCMLVPNSELQH